MLKKFRKKDLGEFERLSLAEQMVVVSIDNMIKNIFDDNFLNILDAVSTTDIETVKLLLDKRFSIFEEKINEIVALNADTKVIISDVIRNGKRINKKGYPDKLTGQEKIDMIYLIDSANSTIDKFNINDYKTPLKKSDFILDRDRLHDDVLRIIYAKHGISQEEINNANQENLKWNKKYLSLLSRKLYKDEGELSDLLKASLNGDFTRYISDIGNKYGKANLQTKQDFQKNGLDFNQWMDPDVKDIKFDVVGKKCRIKMWDRIPQEDLFWGSKTTCCTALDGTNGASMATYILNKAYNIVELCDDATGDVVGMSRVFMAKVDGEPALIMDNIELNNKFIKNMDFDNDVKVIRDNFFRYMNKYAEKITGNKMAKVYFYAGDQNTPNIDLRKVSKVIDFIGNIHRDDVYVNAACCSYQNPKELINYGGIDWYVVPKKM